MSHNITVKGGTSVRLPTAGKYCDRDIIVTAEGGGLALDVVTASALPDTVVDGQIVVITDTTPGTVYIDTDEPASPVSGDVWVKLEAGADVVLELSEEPPYLRSGLTEAKQWDGSAWSALDGYIGDAGKWTQFAMAIPPVGTAINDMTWAQIEAIASKGIAAQYFKVGDAKEIIINGQIGATEFANVRLWACVFAYNHNPDIEEKNRLTFLIGKSAQTNGRDICVVSDKYWDATSALYFNMNTSASHSGGWKSSMMRNTLLGNSGTPSEPTTNSFMAALPSELRAVMKPCTKYSDNVGSGYATTNVNRTVDYLWLPSEYEIFGARTRSNSGEINFQQQYEYYAAGNSKLRYSHKATTTANAWWTRSVNVGGSTGFCSVNTNGEAYANDANYSIGITPMFCV